MYYTMYYWRFARTDMISTIYLHRALYARFRTELLLSTIKIDTIYFDTPREMCTGHRRIVLIIHSILLLFGVRGVFDVPICMHASHLNVQRPNEYFSNRCYFESQDQVFIHSNIILRSLQYPHYMMSEKKTRRF